MANRLDRDPKSLIDSLSLELSRELRIGSAEIHQGRGRKIPHYRPDINLQPYLSVITLKRPCTSGGVHINESMLTVAEPSSTYRRCEAKISALKAAA